MGGGGEGFAAGEAVEICRLAASRRHEADEWRREGAVARPMEKGNGDGGGLRRGRYGALARGRGEG